VQKVSNHFVDASSSPAELLPIVVPAALDSVASLDAGPPLLSGALDAALLDSAALDSTEALADDAAGTDAIAELAAEDEVVVPTVAVPLFEPHPARSKVAPARTAINLLRFMQVPLCKLPAGASPWTTGGRRELRKVRSDANKPNHPLSRISETSRTEVTMPAFIQIVQG
jgi:hypothetical protein